MRILGIDPGDRRIGLAVSDELGIIARGLDTFDTRGRVRFLDHLGELIPRYGIGEIVVGHPVHLSGGASESSRKAEQLAADLQERFHMRVTLWDERYSSEEARRVLRGERADKATIDKVAAVLILQGYLDSREGGR